MCTYAPLKAAEMSICPAAS